MLRSRLASWFCRFGERTTRETTNGLAKQHLRRFCRSLKQLYSWLHSQAELSFAEPRVFLPHKKPRIGSSDAIVRVAYSETSTGLKRDKAVPT